VFFQQVLNRDLSCASYLIADGGEAVVVDPRWDVEPYLEIARRQSLRITHVLDTHDHADYVSGRVRLARLTGARPHRPARAEHPNGDDFSPGDEVAIGVLRLRALATPGHRPEHLAFAVSDLSRAPEPWLLLSGDSLLIGDLARPDLAVDAQLGAEALHLSLSSLLALGDHVEVWPAHVGGSLCGGANLSGKTSSTIGFERRHNPLLQVSKAEFVRGLIQSVPPRPPNLGRIVELNRAIDGEQPRDPEPLSSDGLLALVQSGVAVLDGRCPQQFDEGHPAGSVNLPAAASGVGTRAGRAVSPDEGIVIVADSAGEARGMIGALQAVGIWSIHGYVVGDRSEWRRNGLPVATSGSWDLDRLALRLRHHDVELVDVRETHEWRTGHVPGSHHLPLHQLGNGRRVALGDNGRVLAVACAAGARAAFAASLLRRAGRRNVVRVAGGGISDLPRHGIELALGAA
jgi:glyoxylase-like metal-dependent hydrolase (beta-lactamase superfamily II)/rhodanese-related sulfurtransferase